MNILTLNTVLPSLTVVVDADKKIHHSSVTAIKNHNEMILPKIQDALKAASLQLKNIDVYACLVGPGSFTGIRVGIATLKAFAFVYKKPTIAINTLEFLSACAPKEAKVFALLGSLDSFFVAEKKNNRLEIISHNVTREKLLSLAKDRDIYTFDTGKKLDFEHQIINPDANVLACLAREKFINKDFTTLTPVYFQLSQAEAQKVLSNLKIEPAKKKDLKILQVIDNLLFEDKWSIDSLKRELSNENKKMYLAKIDTDIIGFIDYVEYLDENSIMKVGVLPEFQGKNIATRLIEFVQNRTINSGKNTLSLEVNENNTAALKLYEKLGFSIRRIRKNYYPNHQNAIEMSKKLK